MCVCVCVCVRSQRDDKSRKKQPKRSRRYYRNRDAHDRKKNNNNNNNKRRFSLVSFARLNRNNEIVTAIVNCTAVTRRTTVAHANKEIRIGVYVWIIYFFFFSSVVRSALKRELPMRARARCAESANEFVWAIIV